MKTVFSGDFSLFLGFRGSHVLVTYTYASTVLGKAKIHPEVA